MTILRIYISVLLLLGSLAGGAQVRPDQFPLQTNITGTNFEVYSQYGGVNTKTLPIYMKEYFVPNVDSAWQAFTFTDSIGVVDSLRMMFIKDNRGRVFYVDADGDALLLKDTAQAVGNVYALATLADTSTVASPVEGDIAVIGSDTLLFYETYWLMFAGGAGGIYGGSGTVPASTWVEQLGSLIFDIDSLGSFTVGDIDEKNTGAKISISNTGGNDGGIIIKSGSGAGYTDATVEVNNYYLPGTTPTGEGLPAGDYMWIVSQAGVRKGQDSTGWIHIDSLLSGYTTGSGTIGTLPIWTGAGTLGNSSLTESGQIISSSLTGALKVPSGTDAEVPVWAAGQLRYNTTQGGFQGGTSGYYLPWADSDNFTLGSIPFSNGSRLIQDNSGLFFDSGNNELRINESSDLGAYELQLGGDAIIRPNLDNDKITIGLNGQFFEIANTTAYSSSLGLKITGSKRVILTTSVSGWDSYIEAPPSSNTEGWAQIGNSYFGGRSISIYGGEGSTVRWEPTTKNLLVGFGGNSTTTQYSTWLHIKGSDSDSDWSGGNARGGDVAISGGISNDGGSPGDVCLAWNGSSLIGNIGAGTGTPTTFFDINGKTRIRNLPDSLYSYRVLADANGRLVRSAFAYAEMYVTDTNPDTITFAGGSTTPDQPTDLTAGELANFTYSAGRLTYTGAETAKFLINTSISFSFSEGSTEIEGWIYKDGAEVSKSEMHRKIGTGGDVGNGGQTCIVELATNNYIEIFFAPVAHTGDDDLIITNMNINLIKI